MGERDPIFRKSTCYRPVILHALKSFLYLTTKHASLESVLHYSLKKLNDATSNRGGASFKKVGWTRGKIYCQKVYLMFLTSFLLRNEYRPEESGVDMSTPVHPVAPPLTSKEFPIVPLINSCIFVFIDQRQGIKVQVEQPYSVDQVE